MTRELGIFFPVKHEIKNLIHVNREIKNLIHVNREIKNLIHVNRDQGHFRDSVNWIIIFQ